VKIIVDASVALKWFIEEPGSIEAAALLVPGVIRIAPDLIFAEACNAAWKALRRGLIVPSQYIAVTGRLGDVLTETVPTVGLVPRAGQIAVDLDHPVYDAFYLALAEARNAPLITADERLLKRVASTSWRDRVINLHGWAI
jgi:predicted nucleic acid-binding protein